MADIKLNGVDINILCQIRNDTNYGAVPAMKYFKKNGQTILGYVRGGSVDIPIKLNGKKTLFDSIGVRPLVIVRAMDTSNNMKIYIQRASDGRIYRTLNNTTDSDFTIAPASLKLKGLYLSYCAAGGAGGGSSGGSGGAGGGGGGSLFLKINIPLDFVGVICRMDFSGGNAYLNWRNETGVYLATLKGGDGEWNNNGAGSAGSGFQEAGDIRMAHWGELIFYMGEYGGRGGSASNKGGDAMRMMMQQTIPEDSTNTIFWKSDGGTGGASGGSGEDNGGGGGASAWGNGATGAPAGQNNGRNGGYGAGGSGGGAKTWTFTNRQGGVGGQAGIWYLY